MRATFLPLALLAAPAFGQERQLHGQEISDLLPKVVATGVNEDTQQTFSTSGATQYHADGRQSIGTWWVTATQYCSNWPPFSGRACYDVYLDETAAPMRMIWIGQSGAAIKTTLTFMETPQ